MAIIDMDVAIVPRMKRRFPEKEPARGEEQETVLQMISRHFHAHTFIPDQNGTHKTPEQLHRDSGVSLAKDKA
jgi:hypothetical protein